VTHTDGAPASPEIIPRWEWRAFGTELGSVGATFAPPTPDMVQESDELYVLSSAGTDAVKVRDGLMDVKHLVGLQDDGLEQWTPVMKAAFPLAAAEVANVLLALGVEAPSALSRAAYDMQALLDEVVDPSPDLLAVEVHKRRERFTIGGCMAEVTEVRTRHATTHTIAIESEDADRVIATVRELGLASRPNVSFVRGLKTLVRFGTERVAVVDVGTNSVKFHIGEHTADGWRRIVDRAAPTRLGDGLQESGQLNAEPMHRTVEAIADMVEEARRHRVAAIAAVGTAGLRMAPNSADFVAAVQARSGLVLEIISGEQEGHLAYLAAMAGIGQVSGSRAVFDTGGGSSQFTFGSGEQVEERFSVNVGAVRYTETYGLGGAVSPGRLAEALAALDHDLARLDGRPSPQVLVGLGGALTNMASVRHGLADYDPDVVQGTVLDLSEVDRQIELYRGLDLDERRQVVGLQPQRADIILAGACIVRTVLGKLGQASLAVSDRGLRHGVLEDRFGPRPDE
jgi:exopolyphosphatase/guanosine-5'-triphosphate,3'-diphosphate pyrophosphatase